MVYLGGEDKDKDKDKDRSDDKGQDYKSQLNRAEEKIAELNNVVSDQEKEIELLKYFSNSSKKDQGKNSNLRTIEENGNVYF